MLRNKYVVEGFEFENEHQENIAKSEVKSINYIVSRTDMNNPKSVLVVYNRIIDKKLFKTPIGIKFLKEIQEMLLANSEIEESMIKPIPVVFDFSPVNPDKPIKNPKQKYKKIMINSIVLNILLIVVIILIFIITSNSKNINIINYENRIKAQYSAWEQELNQRESVLNTTN